MTDQPRPEDVKRLLEARSAVLGAGHPDAPVIVVVDECAALFADLPRRTEHWRNRFRDFYAAAKRSPLPPETYWSELARSARSTGVHMADSRRFTLQVQRLEDFHEAWLPPRLNLDELSHQKIALTGDPRPIEGLLRLPGEDERAISDEQSAPPTTTEP